MDGVRITAISLRRRPDRWAACEKHMRSVLPANLQSHFDVLEGTDAKELCGGLTGEERLPALERGAGCTVWRDWPITEVEDARRAFPAAAELPDAEAWLHYERTVAKRWRPDRARNYVGFFFRFLTAGDVGACMSHLRVAERGHEDGVSIQFVFEDDSRPTVEAVPTMLDEIATLQAKGVAWDMIYLFSAQYDRLSEQPVYDGSRLHFAGHRKAHHAYVLSARGMRKLATCGLRETLLPYDDFLPSLHSTHPRPDVMGLPCVAAGRRGGFVALTFSDEEGRALCGVAEAGSDSKAGPSGAAVLLGDAGVEMGGTEEGEELVAVGGVQVSAMPAGSATA